MSYERFVSGRDFTHFPISDEGEPGDFFTENQFEDFMGAIGMLKRRGIVLSCVMF